MSAVTEAETVPPGIAVTLRVADSWPAPLVDTCTSMGQPRPGGRRLMQPLAPIEKSVPSGAMSVGTGRPLGEPPTLVTVNVRVSPPICGTPKSCDAGEIEMLAGCVTCLFLQRCFFPWALFL